MATFLTIDVARS